MSVYAVTPITESGPAWTVKVEAEGLGAALAVAEVATGRRVEVKVEGRGGTLCASPSRSMVRDRDKLKKRAHLDGARMDRFVSARSGRLESVETEG